MEIYNSISDIVDNTGFLIDETLRKKEPGKGAKL